MFGQREEAKNLNCVLIYFHWFGDMNNLYKDLDKCGCSKFLRLPRAALQMIRTWAELFRGDVEPKTRH
jgi:hypothetical protein